MNSSTTWTSGGLRMDRSWTGSESRRTNPTSCQTTLRLEQKTSGLFDREQAGNPTVAGKASKLGLMYEDDMDLYKTVAPGEALGELFQEIPTHMTEADFLDSYMDLSNFLMPDEAMKGSEMDDVVDDGEMKWNLDFSGLGSHLDDTPTVMAAVEQTVTSTTPSPRKRKPAKYLTVDWDTVNMVGVDLGLEGSVPDHDYVSKKPKLASRDEDVVPTPSTSKAATVVKSKTKYRERRDKNNVASRRSREIRKTKYVEMNNEADVLEVKNEALRKKIDELENLAKIMKAELIKKMTGK